MPSLVAGPSHFWRARRPDSLNHICTNCGSLARRGAVGVDFGVGDAEQRRQPLDLPGPRRTE